MILKTRSASNFLACGLCNEGRTREPTCCGSVIDLVDERLIERNIDANRPASIREQRNSEQHGSRFDRRFDVLVAQDNVRGTRRLWPLARTFQRFRMLTKSRSRIRNSFFQGLASRETSLDIWKPDAKGTIGLFFHNRYVMRRHCFETSSCLWSRTPTSKLVDPTHEPSRQIPPRMRHGDDHIPLGMLERMMVAIDPIKHPPVLLQHPDQLAAVSFRRPPQKHRRDHRSRLVCMLTRSGRWLLPGKGLHTGVLFLCKDIHTLA